jgi:hypothetical protein
MLPVRPVFGILTAELVNDNEYYLFVSFGGQANSDSVFYKVKGEALARNLCELFQSVHGELEGKGKFSFRASKAMSLKDRVLLDEMLDCVEVYSDPDRGIYDPQPSKELWMCGQYAVQAGTWETSLRKKGVCDEAKQDGVSSEGATDGSGAEALPTMSPEDARNSGLSVLMLLAQAYYKMLESAVGMAAWCSAVDLELNHSYLWTVNNLQKLLQNHSALKDFPMQFSPSVPDLFPSSIRDWEWDDMMAPEAEKFLSTVQQYVMTKGIYEPEKGSPAWVFIELFRPGVNAAIEQATSYQKRMRQGWEQMLRNASSNEGPKGKDAEKEPSGGGAWAQPEVNRAKDQMGVVEFEKGRLKIYAGYKVVIFDGVPYDLSTRAQARLCLEYMVKEGAFDIQSARHFVKQIDPFVREGSNCARAADPKIDHYFNPPPRKLPELRKALIQSTGLRDGRYFLKVE